MDDTATPMHGPTAVLARSVHVVGLGGTLRPNSSTERTLRVVLDECSLLGASTTILCGADIDLPTYAPERRERTAEAVRLIEELRRADAIVLASPGYHGGVSGLVKNAIDYVEDMRGDERVYFDRRPVACLATGAGWQGTTATLGALRGIVHALRGWPTPLGVAVNSSQPTFDGAGRCIDPELRQSLGIVAHQLVEFARRW